MASSDLAASLSVLNRAASRLNNSSDAVNSTIRDVELQLQQANIGLEVWLDEGLECSDTEGSSSGESTWIVEFLGFAKIGSDWRIATKSVRFVSGFFEGDLSAPYQNTYLDRSAAPLATASRSIRIAAIDKLPMLAAALAQKADHCADVIERATRRL